MKVDYLIIGQGVSGSFLSYFLMKEGASVLVIDDAKPNTASRVASGVINPVTGRRVVKTWMIDDIMPFAEKAYTEIGNFLSLENIINKVSILDFLPTTQMLDAFQKRVDENADYVSFVETEIVKDYFNFPFKVGEINTGYNIFLPQLLSAYRNYLLEKKFLRNEIFDWNNFFYDDDKIVYKDVEAKKIICCDGIEAIQHKYFNQLPFAFNKGEALIVDIPLLSKKHVYKMGYTIVPMLEENLFWVGSNYQWSFADKNPTRLFRLTLQNHLDHWLKIPYAVVDHIASVRPANVERRPFVGLHPQMNNVGILNGMGSKGCSLAPYFAYQLAHHLLYGKEIELLADVKRFQNILTK